MREKCARPHCEVRPTRPSRNGFCAIHDSKRYAAPPQLSAEERENRRKNIIEEYVNGARIYELAKKYELHQNTVSVYVKPYREERKARLVQRVREAYMQNPFMTHVARELGISSSFVSAALDEELIHQAKAALDKRQFLSKIHKTDSCWIWTGSLRGRGYGAFRDTSAHRVAYEMFVGPITDGLHVHHECGLTFCVNPDHLRLATHTENVGIRNGHFSFRGYEWADFDSRIEYINQHQNLHRERVRGLREEMMSQ